MKLSPSFFDSEIIELSIKLIYFVFNNLITVNLFKKSFLTLEFFILLKNLLNCCLYVKKFKQKLTLLFKKYFLEPLLFTNLLFNFS